MGLSARHTESFMGGSNSIKNLWPESHRTSPWNAQVKDRLEAKLRELVCSGQLDLKTASYCAVYPPSTMMSWPVVKAAPGELSQSTALAISSGIPMRLIGVCDAIVLFISVSPLPKARSNISVWIGPGETLLMRTPCLANSSAAVLVRPITANLLAT